MKHAMHLSVNPTDAINPMPIFVHPWKRVPVLSLVGNALRYTVQDEKARMAAAAQRKDADKAAKAKAETEAKAGDLKNKIKIEIVSCVHNRIYV